MTVKNGDMGKREEGRAVPIGKKPIRPASSSSPLLLMKDPAGARARAFAANAHADPYAARRRAARRKAARSPLNGTYVTTAKSPRRGVRFRARVTRFGVEVRPLGRASEPPSGPSAPREEKGAEKEGAPEKESPPCSFSFEFLSDFRHDLAEGYIRPLRPESLANCGGRRLGGGGSAGGAPAPEKEPAAAGREGNIREGNIREKVHTRKEAASPPQPPGGGGQEAG